MKKYAIPKFVQRLTANLLMRYVLKLDKVWTKVGNMRQNLDNSKTRTFLRQVLDIYWTNSRNGQNFSYDSLG